MRSCIFFVLFSMLSLYLTAQTGAGATVIRLPQLSRPNFLAAGNGYLVISEESSRVHVFRLKGDSLEPFTSFGREGQGPGEFDWIHQLRILADSLEIPTYHKYARFSFEGKLIEEIRVLIPVTKNRIFRIQDHYLAYSAKFDSRQIRSSITLYGADFKPIREIGSYRTDGGYSRINLISDCFTLRVYNDLAYVCTSSAAATTLEAFDIHGKLQTRISLPLESFPVTAAMKEQYTRPMKEGLENQANWKETEKLIFFPDSTPGLDDLFIQEDRIICRSHKRRDGLVEFVVFDLKGQEISRKWLFDCGRNVNGRLYGFDRGRYFYLQDEVDEEVWMLHIEAAYR